MLEDFLGEAYHVRSVAYQTPLPSYTARSGYTGQRLDGFYVHVPPGSSVRFATAQELGEGVLGTANVLTGEIRLLYSLDPAERNEVLLHETLHLRYPMHPEHDIRSMTRTILGPKYCRFH